MVLMEVMEASTVEMGDLTVEETLEEVIFSRFAWAFKFPAEVRYEFSVLYFFLGHLHVSCISVL